MKIPRWLQLLLGLAISAVGLWVFLHDVDMGKLGQRLATTKISALVGCVCLTLLTLWLRALRWGLMLPRVAGAHTRGLTGTVFIGYMVNNILPARAGEAVRAFLVWKRNGYSVAVAVGSLLVERILDTSAFMVFFFVPVLGFGLMPSMAPYAIAMAAITAGVVAFLALYAVLPDLAERLVDRFVRLLPAQWLVRSRTIARDLLATLSWTRSWKRSVPVAVLSFVTLLCYAGMFLLLTDRATFGFPHALSATAFAALGAAIPLSPGYVGTLHAALLKGLTMLGQERESARAVAILYHALGYIPTTIVGLFYFFRLDLRFSDLSRARETIT